MANVPPLPYPFSLQLRSHAASRGKKTLHRRLCPQFSAAVSSRAASTWLGGANYAATRRAVKHVYTTGQCGRELHPRWGGMPATLAPVAVRLS